MCTVILNIQYSYRKNVIFNNSEEIFSCVTKTIICIYFIPVTVTQTFFANIFFCSQFTILYFSHGLPKWCILKFRQVKSLKEYVYYSVSSPSYIFPRQAMQYHVCNHDQLLTSRRKKQTHVCFPIQTVLEGPVFMLNIFPFLYDEKQFSSAEKTWPTTGIRRNDPTSRMAPKWLQPIFLNSVAWFNKQEWQQFNSECIFFKVYFLKIVGLCFSAWI